MKDIDSTRFIGYGATEEETDDSVKALLEASELQAKAQANKIVRKNRREIKRLEEHAYGALLENNFPAYKYAIEKLRTLLKQPFNDEIILTGWQTSRKTIWDIINAGTSKI